ncbi:Transcription elongation factor A protein 2 [Larimichthys crocea]|uniref:Uncharacterized protein n=1 Tax=Larimichthys crocea TaxID=215358 RepID=A0ACD3RDB8_LARCR|nr:Transcription elongation factor A protein 2 [Larimichthys crocea]
MSLPAPLCRSQLEEVLGCRHQAARIHETKKKKERERAREEVSPRIIYSSGIQRGESDLNLERERERQDHYGKIKNYNSQRPTVSHNNKREAGSSSWERRSQTGCVKRRKERKRGRERICLHINGGGEGGEEGEEEVTERKSAQNQNMAKNQEVERIAKKLDKMVTKKNTDGALDLLRELKNIKMSLETLQSTRVGMSVNAVRKQSSDEEVQTLAKGLIKSWKKLLDGSEEKEKKKDCSPVRSSSTSKDSGSSEKRSVARRCPVFLTPNHRYTSYRIISASFNSKKSGESPTTPTTPTTPNTPTTPTTPTSPTTPTLPPRTTSFPPAPVTTNSIFQEFKSTDMKYKSRLRSRISNLKDQKNPDLRRNVLCGNISPQRIASMTAEVHN